MDLYREVIRGIDELKQRRELVQHFPTAHKLRTVGGQEFPNVFPASFP